MHPLVTRLIRMLAASPTTSTDGGEALGGVSCSIASSGLISELRAIPGFADPFSSISHLLGAVFFAGMTIPLLCKARRTPGGASAGRVASLIIFAFSSVLLLSMSGVFHLLEFGGAARQVLQRLDHAAIFILIAGTFTPIHTIVFRGVLRWGMLAFIWTVAVLGVTLKSVYFTSTPEGLGVSLYVGMGWFGLLSMIVLTRREGFRMVVPMLLGGIAYTVGAVIEFANPRPLVAGVIRAHEIFHVAVLAGLAAHWWFVWSIADQGGPQLAANDEVVPLAAAEIEAASPVVGGSKTASELRGVARSTPEL